MRKERHAKANIAKINEVKARSLMHIHKVAGVMDAILEFGSQEL